MACAHNVVAQVIGKYAQLLEADVQLNGQAIQGQVKSRPHRTSMMTVSLPKHALFAALIYSVCRALVSVVSCIGIAITQ